MENSSTLYNLSEKFKHEWIMREYGSYEDAGKPKDHVVAILERSPKNKVKAANEEEKIKLAKSASYVSMGYTDDDQIKASNAISRFSKIK